MKDFKYKCVYVASKILKNKEIISTYFRKNGMKIGKNCNIISNIMTPEAYLVEIGNDVTIGAEVDLITHDNSIMKIDSNHYNLFGYIKIGNNCFIGERSTILYGVTLGNNIIVAAGSVVTHSFKEEKIIIGGNPARKIGTWKNFFEKNKTFAMGYKEAKEKSITMPEMFIDRDEKNERIS